mmetsp:Transcript_13032/g.24253  ORF Transcript_13032/g.24253 Transcript_13032/m.24253 type:complete len:252 (+) Transcript_13032:785-1540(+)
MKSLFYHFNQMQITALDFNIDAIGKRVKSSKKKYTWHVAVDDDVHCVELFISFLSNKRKLFCDGNVVMVQSHFSTPLDYDFRIGKAPSRVLILSGEYELEVNGNLFSKLFKALTEPEQPDFSSTETEKVPEPQVKFENWKELGEEEPAKPVKGLGFEEWEVNYSKIQPKTAPEPPKKSHEEDLLSFEEIPTAPALAAEPEVDPKLAYASQMQYNLQQMAYLQQLQQMQQYQLQMQQMMKYPFMTQRPYQRQ